MITDSSTIKEAKVHVNANLDKGTICPCCDQHVQSYQWGLNPTFCSVLLAMYDFAPYSYIENIRDILPDATDRKFAILRHWNLIEGKIPEKVRDNQWRLTKLGRDFIKSGVRVPRKITRHNGACYGYVDPTDTISFAEVMSKPSRKRKTI